MMMRRKTHFVLLSLVHFLLLFRGARTTIVLFGNETLSYPSIDASFTPLIPAAGILGEISIAEPLNGCSPLAVNATTKTAFVVIERGECLFDQKVQNGQNAGFAAVIVFNNYENEDLVTMSGDGTGITAYALFLTNKAGYKLLSLGGIVYLLPGYRKKVWVITWLIITVSVIVIVMVGALVTALCCIQQHILAQAEKEAYNENLLHNDNDTLFDHEFIPDDLGPEVLRAEDAMTDTESEQNDAFQSEGPSDSDDVSDT